MGREGNEDGKLKLKRNGKGRVNEIGKGNKRGNGKGNEMGMGKRDGIGNVSQVEIRKNIISVFNKFILLLCPNLYATINCHSCIYVSIKNTLAK